MRLFRVYSRKANRRRGLYALCTALSFSLSLLVSSSSGEDERPRWQAGTSISYLTGDFGTDVDTDFVYWDMTVKRLFERGQVSVILPYLHIKDSGGQTFIDGIPQVTSGTGVSESETNSGVGDLLVKGTYYWIEQEGWRPFIDITAKIKLPTADEDDGLGTGEPDVEFGAEAVRRFMNSYMMFLDVYYTFIGEPSGSALDDRVAFDVGLGYDLNRDLMVSIFYELRTAVNPSSPDSESVQLLLNYKLSESIRTYGMLDVGLSDGASDYGLTVGGSYRF